MESTKLHFASALTAEGWKDDVTVTVEGDGPEQTVSVQVALAETQEG